MKYLIRHILLRVVSAEFHTSRSETRQLRKSRKLKLLDSYRRNLPSSVKILEAHGNSEILAMTLLLLTQTIKNDTIL